MRSAIRNVSAWLFGGMFTAVASEFFVHVAEDKGFYADAGKRWDAVMGPISGFLSSQPVLIFTAFLGGLVLGLWVDAWLARREQHKNALNGDDGTPGSLTEHIFVGNVSVSAGTLEDLVLLISVEGRNMSGRSIEIYSVCGHIKAKLMKRSGVLLEDYGNLPSATIRSSGRIANRSDFWISVEQRVPASVAATIDATSADVPLHLDFEEFNIMARQDGDDNYNGARLRIWDGAVVYKLGGQLVTYRNVIIRSKSA